MQQRCNKFYLFLFYFYFFFPEIKIARTQNIIKSFPWPFPLHIFFKKEAIRKYNPTYEFYVWVIFIFLCVCSSFNLFDYLSFYTYLKWIGFVLKFELSIIKLKFKVLHLVACHSKL